LASWSRGRSNKSLPCQDHGSVSCIPLRTASNGWFFMRSGNAGSRRAGAWSVLTKAIKAMRKGSVDAPSEPLTLEPVLNSRWSCVIASSRSKIRSSFSRHSSIIALFRSCNLLVSSLKTLIVPCRSRSVAGRSRVGEFKGSATVTLPVLA